MFLCPHVLGLCGLIRLHLLDTNVSIMNLTSYIEDKDVKEVLSGYGKFKSKIIRLKYKSDHDLAGLVNGKRSVKRVLEKKSIPYSLRIAGEWWRVIHNNKQPICSECQVGHTRKRCPTVKCRVCNELGHMSFDYDKKEYPPENNTETDQSALWANSWIDTWFFRLCLMLSGLGILWLIVISRVRAVVQCSLM